MLFARYLGAAASLGLTAHVGAQQSPGVTGFKGVSFGVCDHC